jgi:hypothetical protein
MPIWFPIVILIEAFWLLKETNWMTIRLPRI